MFMIHPEANKKIYTKIFNNNNIVIGLGEAKLRKIFMLILKICMIKKIIKINQRGKIFI